MLKYSSKLKKKSIWVGLNYPPTLRFVKPIVTVRVCVWGGFL